MNIRNNFVFIFISVLILMGYVQNASGAEYHVKNGGNDTLSGSNDENAWATLGKLNTFNFADGDVIYLKRGSTFSDATITLSAVAGSNKTITIRDYDSGSLPWINANVIQPMLLEEGSNPNISGIIIRNIDMSGLDFDGFWPYGRSNVTLSGIKNITIDNLYIDGHQGAVDYKYKECFVLLDPGPVSEEMNAEIMNSTLINGSPDPILYPPADWGDDPAPASWDNRDHYCISGYRQSDRDDDITLGTISLHDNVIGKTWGDSIQLKLFKNTVNIYNNEMMEYGENALDFKSCSNVNVYNNDFTRGNYASGGSGGGNGDIATHQRSSNGIYGDNIKIYGNRFHDHGYFGIRILGHTSNMLIYNNLFENVSLGLSVGNSTTWGVKIYNNVFLQTGGPGSVAWAHRAAIWLQNSGYDDVEVFNNSIYSDSTYQNYGIVYDRNSGHTGVHIHDNAIEMNQTGSTKAAMYMTGTASNDTIIDHNTYYAPNGANAVRNVSDYSWSNWVSAHPNDKNEDPGFNDTSGGDLSTYASSNIVNDGSVNASVIGLHSNTSWVMPINVITVDRSSSAPSDRGAYEYTAADTAAPAKPTGLEIVE